jgi:hypothetical protein
MRVRNDWDEDEDEDDFETDPRPQLLADPARMAKQMCSCDHSRLAHGSGFMGCEVIGCECMRYTWVPDKPKKAASTCYCCDEPAIKTLRGGMQVCAYHARQL